MKKHFILTLILVLIISFLSKSQTVIQMTQSGGVYTMPCKVNGLKLNFIVDTGASDVSISLTEALFMLKNGFLSESDITGSSYFQLANGEIIEGTTINLRMVEIGDRIITNVDASITHTLDAPLLLGQSALRHLGYFSINYSNNTFVIYGDVTQQQAITIRERESQKITADRRSFVCGNNVNFIYRGNTVTYRTIERGGLCWMDRNLGASSVPTSSTDARGYGDLFQWGRGDDGHQGSQSWTSFTLSNKDVPGHGDFIAVSSSPYDWRSPQNDYLWQGVRGINNPCPPGWRVPTEAELNAERQSWSSNNSAGAYASTLKWPVGGYRLRYGHPYFVGSIGYVWSSSVGGADARRLGFSSGNAGVGSFDRALGASVRCVRDL